MRKLVLPDNLVNQWHPTKNPPLLPGNIPPTGINKPWWVDEHSHEWEAEIYRRVTRRTGCPYCANKKKLVGFNDLATTHPEIVALWHPTENNTPEPPVNLNDRMKFWWKGSCGHSWQRDIVGMKASNICPACQGQQVIIGTNDLASQNPELAAQWHPTQNPHFSDGATTIHCKSNIVVWWQCNNGHEWEQSPNARSKNGLNCPTCSGKRILADFNDLKTLHPELAAEWHPTRNGKFLPQKVRPQTHQKIWWLGKCGHEWESSIGHRFNGSGCPICSGRQVLQNYNDLASQNPELAKEWHPTKNNVQPTEITVRSGQNIWWLCAKGHEWIISPSSRNHGLTCCPDCNRQQYTSKSEQEISKYLTQLGIAHLTNDRKILKGTELDIYIPSKKLAIEFNGLYWHNEMAGKHRYYHYNKWMKAKTAEIQLIQIWEDDWNENPQLIKTMLAHKLGIATQPKIFARKTFSENVSTEEAKKFLTLNHIQGFASGSYYLGLHDKKNNALVALLVLKQEKGGGVNIIRYATSAHIVGGFTKLLAYATTNYAPNYYLTFADHAVSDGGLYEANGFVADKELPPDYMYVRGNKRHHKFGYRIKKFINDPTLTYMEGLTERELADLNKIPRIWDAGKTRYVKNVKSNTQPH